LRGVGDATSALIGGGISAGVGLATSGLSLWMNSITLSHEADTATTQIVNGLEPLLNQNKNAYLAGPGTCADQAAALAAFDSAIQWLRSPQACGNGAYGSAGNRCISDRLCESGCPFPWIAWYRDPIANDPRASGCAAQLAADNPNAGQQSAVQNIMSLISGSNVQTNAGQFDTTASTTGSSILPSSVAGIPMEYVLLGGGALILLMAVSR